LIGFNLADVVLFEQAPQALMSKALDHRPTVKRQLTFVNTEALRSKLTSYGTARRAANDVFNPIPRGQLSDSSPQPSDRTRYPEGDEP
jgi:hypothetical protein